MLDRGASNAECSYITPRSPAYVNIMPIRLGKIRLLPILLYREFTHISVDGN